MSIINMLFGVPLGYLMYACYKLAGDYGISIILFTFFAKLLMFPLSLYSQKNSIIMVKIIMIVYQQSSCWRTHLHKDYWLCSSFHTLQGLSAAA